MWFRNSSSSISKRKCNQPIIPERAVAFTERVHHSNKELQWWLSCKACGTLHPKYLIFISKSVFSFRLSLGFDFAALSFLWSPRIIQCLISRYHSWHFTYFLLVSLKSLPSILLLMQILPHPRKKNLPFSQDIQPCKNCKVMKWRRDPQLKRTAKCFAGKKKIFLG